MHAWLHPQARISTLNAGASMSSRAAWAQTHHCGYHAVASVFQPTLGYEPVKLCHSFPPDDQIDGAFAAAIRRV
jgi:hypothetical protein